VIRLCRWCSAQLVAGAVDWCCNTCECAYYLDRGAIFEARLLAKTNRIAWADVESQQRGAQWGCIQCGSVPVKHRGGTCDKHDAAAGQGEAPNK